MLLRGSSSFSVWVHLRGLELTADWFEYQIRETWIHSLSRFTKWVEATSYARLTSSRVASFISYTSFEDMEFLMS